MTTVNKLIADLTTLGEFYYRNDKYRPIGVDLVKVANSLKGKASIPSPAIILRLANNNQEAADLIEQLRTGKTTVDDEIEKLKSSLDEINQWYEKLYFRFEPLFTPELEDEWIENEYTTIESLWPHLTRELKLAYYYSQQTNTPITDRELALAQTDLKNLYPSATVTVLGKYTFVIKTNNGTSPNVVARSLIGERIMILIGDYNQGIIQFDPDGNAHFVEFK